MEIWARRAASVMLSPHFLRSRLSFSPKSRAGLASYVALAGKDPAMASLIPGTFSRFTSCKYLIRFRMSRTSGVYRR